MQRSKIQADISTPTTDMYLVPITIGKMDAINARTAMIFMVFSNFWEDLKQYMTAIISKADVIKAVNSGPKEA